MPTVLELEAMLDDEVASVKRKTKPFSCTLVRQGEYYRAYARYPMEGSYAILYGEKQAVVELLWDEDHFEIDADTLDTEAETLAVQLTKDETAILTRIKETIKAPLDSSTGFIVGPPGTGKTKVISKIIERAIAGGARRIGVFSPTNMAVENVFESMDTEAMGLKFGEVVCSIKTEIPSLQSLSPKQLHEARLDPIKDAIEVLQKAKPEAYRALRDLSASIEAQQGRCEENAIAMANARQDLHKVTMRIEALKTDADKIGKRQAMLQGNALLRTLTGAVLGTKTTDLSNRLDVIRDELATLEPKALALQASIESEDTDKSKAQKTLSDLKARRAEVDKRISTMQEELQKYQKQLDTLSNKGVFKEARLIGATLVSAAINRRLQQVAFDIIIVDEASMASFPLITAACQNLIDAKRSYDLTADDGFNDAQNGALRMALGKKLIFVGDPMQLSPIANTFEMRKSIFAFYGIEQLFHGVQVPNAAFLDTNYRCHPDIVELASRLFYGGLLKAGKNASSRSLYVRRSRARMQRAGSTYQNETNAGLALAQVKRALERGRRSIGVITPFRGQAELIGQGLESLAIAYEDADLQAGTVHKFQGKERDIIIFDLTFTPSGTNSLIPTYEGDRDSQVAKMLNVAMTRAKDFFIVIGDIEALTSIPQENMIVKEWLEGILELQKKGD